MGIIKLFSKYRDENTTSVALNYDQRRHSSISLFNPPTTIQQSKTNQKQRYSMAFENDMIKKQDSAIFSSIAGFASVNNDESLDSSMSTFAPTVNHDVQNVVQILRETGSELTIQPSPKQPNRHFKSKSVNLSGLKCTCHMPHVGPQNKSRISAPVIKIDSSNKCEVSASRKEDQNFAENYLFGATKLDNTVYSDLVTIEQQLRSVISNSTPLVNKSIEGVINRLAQTLEKTSYLESRLHTVVEVSKEAILNKSKQLDELKKQNENEKKSLDLALEDNKMLKNKLTEKEDLIKQIEHALNENQIEPTQEQGGTIIQQVESLLAIATSFYLFNEKLTSGLENSDKRIQELLNQVDELNITIANHQELQKRDEISDLKGTIMNLEECIADLNTELRSSKDAIYMLDHEKMEENNELKNSNNLLKQKISEVELHSDVTIKYLENKNNHLREENMQLLKEKQSLISQKAAAKKKNKKSFGAQKNGNQSEMEYIHILETKQSFLKESYKSNTERPTIQGAYDHSLASEWKNNILFDGENIEYLPTANYSLEKNMNNSIEGFQRTISQSSSISQDTNKHHIKDLQSATLKHNVMEKKLEQTQEFEEEQRSLEKSKEERLLSRSKNSLIESLDNTDKSLLLASSGRPEMNVHIFEKQYQEYKADDSQETMEIVTQKYSNICMENLKAIQETVKAKSGQLEHDMNRLSDSKSIPKAEKKSLEFENKRKSTGSSKENHITLNQEMKLISNTEEEEEEEKNIDVTKEAPLEYQSGLVTSLQQENSTLHEILGCLQNKAKTITLGDNTYKLQDSNSLTCKNLFFRGIETREQEELLKMHTRAQLGLIEYLEGEDDVSLAISRFRKLLEIQMKDSEY